MERDETALNSTTDLSADLPSAPETGESRRELLGKIARFGAYTPPALIAVLQVAAPVPSGSL